MNDLLNELRVLAQQSDESLTHFLIQSEIVESQIAGQSRITLEPLNADQTIAIIGGLLVDEKDNDLAMPLGLGLFLHQVSNSKKGTINHSCDPNCKIAGFNRLVTLREVPAQTELTLDYGTVSIGKGKIILPNCNCGSAQCRGVIKTDDFMNLPVENLNAYGQFRRRQLEAGGDL